MCIYIMQIVNLIHTNMKRHYLFLLVVVFLLLGSFRVMGQSNGNFPPVDLRGIWQMCFYVSGNPDVPGELKPSNSFKMLSKDGEFINMTVIPNHGAIVIGSGTYKQTATNAYTEHVDKNIHLPQLIGQDNVLEFELKDGGIMVVKFFVEKDVNGNEINSWFYETWKRVNMPAVYPKDLVR